jgi:c-di-GMP-binding flagellar brake protein YcgR
MPDMKKYFSVGDKVQIEFIDLTGHKHDYISQINKIYDNVYLDVLIPISKNQIIYLKTDTILRLISARGDAVFEVNARIVDKLFGEIPLLKLQVVSDIKKTQRRNFFRLKLLRDIEVQKVIDLKERSFGERFRGYMLDISGGGLMFNSTMLLQENDLIEVALNLNNKKLVLFGLIVRRVYCNNPKAPYSYGVRFERITEFERNEVTKFIFEEQRKLIKKGLV